MFCLVLTGCLWFTTIFDVCDKLPGTNEWAHRLLNFVLNGLFYEFLFGIFSSNS